MREADHGVGLSRVCYWYLNVPFSAKVLHPIRGVSPPAGSLGTFR